jgi:hypothetical protein
VNALCHGAAPNDWRHLVWSWIGHGESLVRVANARPQRLAGASCQRGWLDDHLSSRPSQRWSWMLCSRHRRRPSVSQKRLSSCQPVMPLIHSNASAPFAMALNATQIVGTTTMSGSSILAIAWRNLYRLTRALTKCVPGRDVLSRILAPL